MCEYALRTKSGVCVPVDGDIPVMGFSDCTKDNDKGLCINCANSAEYFLLWRLLLQEVWNRFETLLSGGLRRLHRVENSV